MFFIQTSHRPIVIWVSLIGILMGLISIEGCHTSKYSTGTLVDLTYPFDEHTIYWPNNQPFHWEKVSWGHTPKGYWYASGVFSASEHGGTHLDAPIHFAESGWSVDEIPLTHLTAEAIVIDIRSQASSNPDYTLRVEDITQWESRHGQIPRDTIVLLLTGWSQYWPDASQYLGSSTPKDSTSLHFPGFSAESVSFLLHQRNIVGIGIDAASIDPGQSQTFPVHQILAEGNCFALENVAHLEQLPPRGATITALPMKIKGGTGAPVRVMAVLP